MMKLIGTAMETAPKHQRPGQPQFLLLSISLAAWAGFIPAIDDKFGMVYYSFTVAN